MRSWNEVESWLRAGAHQDVSECGSVRPALVGCRGDRPVLVAWLRPFAAGEGAAALSEVVAVATPLGVDRVAAVYGGRMWSLDDDGTVATAAGHGEALVCAAAAHGEQPRCTLTPYEQRGGTVVWGEPLAGDATGWLPQMLRAAVADPVGRRDPDEVGRRLRDCLHAGHEVGLLRAGGTSGTSSGR